MLDEWHNQGWIVANTAELIICLKALRLLAYLHIELD